jgi:Protein of unknown function (DUF2845)
MHNALQETELRSPVLTDTLQTLVGSRLAVAECPAGRAVHGRFSPFGSRCRMRTLPVVLSGIVLSLAAITAQADALRCGNKLIREGDTRALVRSFCGEPADVQTRYVLRRPIFSSSSGFAYSDSAVEVPVETWTFNFGPYKLMRRIRFVDGLVEDIETLGYGYREPYQ